MVLRTFSKAYGLAGLRIGYAVGPEYVMDAARAAAIPLSVTDPAQRAALVSLDPRGPAARAGGPDRGAARRGVAAAGRPGAGDTPRPNGNFVWLPTVRTPPRRTTSSPATGSSRGRSAMGFGSRSASPALSRTSSPRLRRLSDTSELRRSSPY
ncbi:MAG: aminotransferase class I/II-fold pyridoxal phosphate-dependent enzyme [Galbitalea sp.]